MQFGANKKRSVLGRGRPPTRGGKAVDPLSPMLKLSFGVNFRNLLVPWSQVREHIFKTHQRIEPVFNMLKNVSISF